MELYHPSGLNKKQNIYKNNFINIEYENNNCSNNFFILFWKTIDDLNKNIVDSNTLNNILLILSKLNESAKDNCNSIIRNYPKLLVDENIFDIQLKDTSFRKIIYLQVNNYINSISSDNIIINRLISEIKKILQYYFSDNSMTDLIQYINNYEYNYVNLKSNNFKQQLSNINLNNKEIINNLDVTYIKDKLGFNLKKNIVDILCLKNKLKIKKNEQSLEYYLSKFIDKVNKIYQNPDKYNKTVEKILSNDIKHYRINRILRRDLISIYKNTGIKENLIINIIEKIDDKLALKISTIKENINN